MSFGARVVVIGNGGGGKSGVARLLAERGGGEYLEVDAVQFGPGWARVSEDLVRERIEQVMAKDKWVIDGFGPYDSILARFELADLIVFVDHPLWVHYWWAMERQIAAHSGVERDGGPEGCDLRDVNKEMCEVIWRVHTELRPKLLEDLKPFLNKVQWIKSPEELDGFIDKIEGMHVPK